jgi:hypothetical protein
MKGGNRGKTKKKGKPISISNAKGAALGGLEGQKSAKAASATKLSSKILDMKVRKEKFINSSLIDQYSLQCRATM